METREASEARAALDALRSAIKAAVEESLQKGFWNRWPAGSPNSTGGQFAPKGNTGGGSAGGGGFKNYLGGLFGGGYGNGSYAPPKPKGPPPGAKPHPKVNDKGEPVTINYPSKPTHSSTWGDANKTAVFTPGSDAPDVLNGVAMKTWNPPKDGWAKVTGTNEKLDADLPFEANPKKSVGAGVLIVEDDGRVWLTRPTNSYGGYQNTYPKGTVESGLTMQQNAIKEAYEETGLKIKIVGILGDYERDTSKARFYLARRTTGTPKNMGWESQAINLATFKDAKKLLNRTHDKQILDDLEDLLSFGPMKKGKGPVSGAWTMQPRWPSGSALGGQWKAIGADGITLPPKLAGGLEGKNPVYQKKLNAIHAAAQAGNVGALDAAIAAHQSVDQKYTSGAKGTSHVKWGASVYQYAVQVRGDVTHKTKASASADAIRGPKTLQSYGPQFAPKPGGSNPGAIYEDGDAKWLVKGNAQKVAGNVSEGVSDNRARNEVLAAKLMQAAGAGAPDMRLVDLQGKFGGGLGVASKMMDGVAFNPKNPAHVAAAQATFATHAWLANYDVLGMGYDNTIITSDGKAVCIDPGGALLFRAQGLPKGEAHGVKNGVLDASAPEAASMRQTTKEQSTVFGSMTQSQLEASAQQLASVSDDTIKKLVDTYGPPNSAEKAALTLNLIARRDAVIAQLGGAQAAQAALTPMEQDDPPIPAIIAAAAAQAMTMDPYTAYKAAADMVSQAEKSATELLADGGLSSKDFKLAMLGELPKMATTAQQVIVAKINNLTNAGDQSGLAQYALELQATLKGVSGFDAQAKNYAQMGLVAITMSKMESAQAMTPAPDIPAKPTFNTGTKYADQIYNDMATVFSKQHAAGNLEALQSFSNIGVKKLYPDGKPWKSGSPNGTKMAEYHAALVNDLQNKQAAVVVAGAKQADAALNTPPAPSPTTPPMPNFAAALLDSVNSNSASNNSKVMTIKSLAESGNVKGLLALSYGSNTYGKKHAKLANDALKALGSTHTVGAGQAKNSHPALTGGVSRSQLASAAQKINQAAPAPVPSKPAQPSPPKKSQPIYLIPEKPDFNNWNGAGKGLSGVAAVNLQNDQVAAKIYELAKLGKIAELKSLTYQPLDKNTGQPSGSVQPVSQHPSQHIKAYFNDALTAATTPYVPPKVLSVRDFGNISEAFQKLSAELKAAEPAKLAQAAQKIGRYGVVGKLGASAKKALDAFQPPEKSLAAGTISNKEMYDASMKAFNSLTKIEQTAVKQYTGSAYQTMNNAATGEGTHSKTGYAISGINKASVPIPAGTVLSRRFSFPDPKDAAKFETQAEGTVLKDFGIISTSMSQAWSGAIELRITVGEGVKGLYVARDPVKGGGAISNHAGENEIILPYGTRFYVRKIHKTGKKDKHGNWGENSKMWVDVVALPNYGG